MHLSCGINEAASKPQGTYTITVNRELGVVNETEKHAAVFGCKARRQQHRQTMSLNSQGIQLDGQQQSVGNSVDYEQLQNAMFVVRELMLQRVVVFLSYKYTQIYKRYEFSEKNKLEVDSKPVGEGTCMYILTYNDQDVTH